MIEPMKAVLSDTPFSDPDWIFERKLDGIRCLAIRDAGGVQLMSRTARQMNDQFPELVEALERQPSEDFIADGEIVAFAGGITSFARLQQRARRRVPVLLYVFDLPRLDGDDLRPLPLRERKARLRQAFEFAGPVIVWDRGSYENLRDEPMEDGLAAGHVSFRLDGEKLQGGWSLRRTDGRRWLLVKRRDEHAGNGDPVAERPESVVSGRTIERMR